MNKQEFALHNDCTSHLTEHLSSNTWRWLDMLFGAMTVIISASRDEWIAADVNIHWAPCLSS